MKAKATGVFSAVTALVLLVPAAGAATRPDDRDGARGPGAFMQQPSSGGGALDTAVRASIQDARSGVVRPDDRPGRREVPLEVPSVVPATADGFDWTDAGVGAGVVAAGGALMLLLAGFFLARHDRRGLRSA